MKEIFSDMLLLMTVLKFADDKTGADSTYFWTILSLTRVLMCFIQWEKVLELQPLTQEFTYLQHVSSGLEPTVK